MAEVDGSSPFGSTKYLSHLAVAFCISAPAELRFCHVAICTLLFLVSDLSRF